MEVEEPVYNAATATDGEKWNEYMRLILEAGISKKYWAANNADQAMKPSYVGQTCGRSVGNEIKVFDLFSTFYDEDQLYDMYQATMLFDEAYCPEKVPDIQDAWFEFQRRATLAASSKPKPKDFTIEIKIREQQCFGSTGCNVTFQIDPAYSGPSDLSGSYDVTYQVMGGDDLIINTFTLKNGNARFDNEEFTGTPSATSKLTAKVIRVD